MLSIEAVIRYSTFSIFEKQAQLKKIYLKQYAGLCSPGSNEMEYWTYIWNPGIWNIEYFTINNFDSEWVQALIRIQIIFWLDLETSFAFIAMPRTPALNF